MSVDNVSKIILDILFQRDMLPPTLNVVHSKPISWSFMITTVRDTLEKKIVCGKLPLVPWAEWMSKVEELGSGQIDESLLQSLVGICNLVYEGISTKFLTAQPALKILRFLQRNDGEMLSVGAPANSNVGSNSKVESFLTDMTSTTSDTFREMDLLTSTDIERWIYFWHLKGLF